MMKSLAQSTRNMYAKTIIHVKDYMISLPERKLNFPIPPKILSWYMCHLFQSGQSPATITSKMSAIAFWHLLLGFKDPINSFEVKRCLMGMRKLKPPKKGRPPLTRNILIKMVNTVSVCNWGKYHKRLFTAMLLLSFHAFLRPGEMTDSVNAIKFKHMTLSSSSVKILFTKYKHSKGEPVKIKVAARNDCL